MKKYILYTVCLLILSGCAFLSNVFGIEVNSSSNTNNSNIDDKTANINDIVSKLYPVKDFVYISGNGYIISKNGSVYSYPISRNASSFSLGYNANNMETLKDYLNKPINIPEPVEKIFDYNCIYALTKSGSLYVWSMTGDNSYCGIDYHLYEKNRKNGIYDPVKLNISEPVKKIIQHNSHYKVVKYILTENGSLYAWGRGYAVGNGNPSADEKQPVKINIHNYINDIVIIQDSIYAISNDGTLYGWGDNSRGQLYLGDTKDRATPTKINFPEPVKEFRNIDNLIYAVTHNGSVYISWHKEEMPIKVDIKERIKDVIKFGNCTYFLTETGTLYSLGSNKDGYLGTGKIKQEIKETEEEIILDEVSEPVKVKINEPVKKLVTQKEEYPVYAITENGSVYKWGGVRSADLLDSRARNFTDEEILYLPEKIAVNEKIKEIYMNNNKSNIYLLTDNGTAYAWGTYNNNGSLGVGDFITKEYPTKVKLDEHIKKLILMEDSVYAITKNGSLYSWGQNEFLGLDSYEDVNIPTKVDINEPVKKLILVSNPVYTVTENGSIYFWEKNKKPKELLSSFME